LHDVVLLVPFPGTGESLGGADGATSFCGQGAPETVLGRGSLVAVLKFNLGDIPVRVHFSFLLIAFIFRQDRIVDMAVWVLVAFLAVLLHEAGHAFAARHYGASPVTITLFALGGVTVYPATQEMTPPRRFVISAMGSIVGIVTGGIVLLLARAGVFDGSSAVVDVAVTGYVWAALGWGVLNWIPIRPLDGGAMLTSFLEIVWPKRALVVAKVISVMFGIAAAVLLYNIGSNFGAIFVLVIMFMGLGGGGDAPSDDDEDDDEVAEPEIIDPPQRRVVDEPPPEFPI
jgi:Zn-dependent protease